MNANALRRWPSLFALLLALSGAPLLAQGADLLVIKSGPAEAPADSDVSYTVTILNGGPDDAASVTLDDPIPAGMTFVSAMQDNGPLFACATPPVGSGGTVSCTIGSLPALASADFTFVFHIAPATPPGTVFLNIATAASATQDPNDENDSGFAATSTPPPPAADLAVAKSGPATAAPGTDVVYSISLTNDGPDSASGLSLQDTLPGDMTFVSFVQDSGPLLTCMTPPAGSGGTVTCTAASFPVGTATFTLTGHIPDGTPSGTVYENSAGASSGTDDPNPTNNDSTTSLSVAFVDVSVAKTGPGTAMGGSEVSYGLTVSNAGPDPAADVVLTDPVPPGTVFVSLTQDSGPLATCITPAPGAGGTVTCTYASLGAGVSAELTLVIRIGNASVTNTASVTTGSFDADSGNDASSVDTAVTAVDVLAIPALSPGLLALLGSALAAAALWMLRRIT